jgi:hypothetical protein
MAPIPISSSEFHLLKKEIETMGEQLSAEGLDRKAEADELRIEIEAIKKTLESVLPNFLELYEKQYADSVHSTKIV